MLEKSLQPLFTMVASHGRRGELGWEEEDNRMLCCLLIKAHS